MTSLAEVIEQAQAGSSAMRPVYDVIHGSHDPAVLAAQVEDLVRDHLDTTVSGALLHALSVGAVYGLELSDGRAVVVKVHQPSRSEAFLGAVLATQLDLVEAGIPCPRPIGGPFPVGLGFATVEEWLDDPGHPDEFGPEERRSSADGFGRIVEVASASAGLVEAPVRPVGSGLYPEPHSPLFDFDATAAGAEWIDELARVVRPYLDIGRTVVAHTDWSARNVRLAAHGVQAVYDLDSLAQVPLASALATAATTWRATAEPGEAAAPDGEEVDAWLGAFPIDLTDDERRATYANAIYSLAYASRCEHAIDPEGEVHQRARPSLQANAHDLLARAGLTRR